MKTKDILKLGLALAAYASAACVLLAGTYMLTKAAKEKQDAIRTMEALQSLFPDLDAYEELPQGKVRPAAEGISAKQVIAAKRKDVVIGLAVVASGRSYQGQATVMTGVGLDGKVAGVKIIEINDTPGLGQNAARASYYVDRARKLTWYGQFTGMASDAPMEVGKDVQAVTASTITSRSLTAIVRASAAAGAAYLAERAQGATE
jgi:electron transport complex protein RnfG